MYHDTYRFPNFASRVDVNCMCERQEHATLKRRPGSGRQTPCALGDLRICIRSVPWLRAIGGAQVKQEGLEMIRVQCNTKLTYIRESGETKKQSKARKRSDRQRMTQPMDGSTRPSITSSSLPSYSSHSLSRRSTIESVCV